MNNLPRDEHLMMKRLTEEDWNILSYLLAREYNDFRGTKARAWAYHMEELWLKLDTLKKDSRLL